MNNLLNKLGPQEHQVLEQSQLYSYYQPINQQYQIPTELDYLLYDIANCTPSTQPDKILSYLAHYYPKLKNKQNIELLTTIFLKCPIFFNSIELLTLENQSKIVECFQFIIIEKYKITNPTSPFHDFYTSIYNSLCQTSKIDPNFYWKSIPILSGLISSINLMKKYNEFPAYSNVIASLNTLFINMYSDSFLYIMKLTTLPNEHKYSFLISLPYIQDHLTDPFYANLSISNPNVLSDLLTLLFFSNYGLEKGSIFANLTISYPVLMKSKPTLRQLNKWVFIFGKISNNLQPNSQSLNLLSSSLDSIVLYCTNISNDKFVDIHLNSDKWDLLKYTFFTIILIFENAVNATISGNLGLSESSFIITNKILRSLFYLSYIVDEIGTGGFDSYNYVFNSSVNLLIERNPELADILIYSLLNGIPASKSKISKIEECKLNYFLKISESLLSILKSSFIQTTLFPLLTFILNNQDSTKNSVELVHSIMIKHLNLLGTSDKNLYFGSEYRNPTYDLIFPYFDKVISQFPKRLSIDQTSLIVQTCGHVINKSSSSTDSTILTLYDLIKFQINLSSYSSLPPIITTINGQETIIPQKLNSRRSALISFLIDTLQFVALPKLEYYLSDIKSEIDRLVGDVDIFKLYDLWFEKIININKYDSQKGQFAIDWWYENINNGLVPKL